MKLKVWLALLAVYIVWGSTYLAIRFVVESIPPLFSGGLRFLISGLILYIWRRAQGDPAPTKVQWRAAAIIGLFLLLGGNGGLVWAEQYIPSGISSLFIATTPLWMVLIDSFRPGGKSPGWLTWFGVLLGLAGIVLLITPWQNGISDTSHLNPFGVAALLFAAFSWTIGSLYSRKAPLPASPLLYTGMEMLAGCAGLFVLSGLTGEWSRLDLSAIQPRSLWGLAYLVFFGSLIGFVSYTWLLRNAPTPLVSTYAYVNPLIAILLGVVFANESLNIWMVISAAIIIGSVVIINYARYSARQVAEKLAGQPPEPIQLSSSDD
jgi:drug/metabolite transporter (DMT)-like permease